MKNKNLEFLKKQKLVFIVACIFLIALLPRLFLAFRSTEIPTYDARVYDERAISILEGKGISEKGKPTSNKEPFYSFFLAAIYFFFGHNYLTVRIIQAVLGSFTCIIIFLISRKLFDFKTGLISALIACFNPGFIKSTEHLLTENLFTFLLVIGIFLLLRQVRVKNFGNLFFLGVTLGIASLTRHISFYFPLFILLFFYKSLFGIKLPLKKYILGILIFILFYCLPILPWTLRNWRLHNRLVPISTNVGINFYSSYFPKDGKFFGFTASDETVKLSEQFDSEVDQDNFLIRQTLKFIKNNPVKIIKLIPLKIAYFLSPFDWEIIGYGKYNFMYVFIFPLFIYGIFVTSHRFKEVLPIYLPIIYTIIIILVTYGSPRIRLPIEPYIIIIASVGIVHFIQFFSAKIYGILLITSYFILNLILYFYSYQTKLLIKYFLQKINFW